MKINSVKHHSIITPKTTGYAAAVSTGLAIWSGMSKNKTFKKQHKLFGFAAALLTVAHIGLVEYISYKYRTK